MFCNKTWKALKVHLVHAFLSLKNREQPLFYWLHATWASVLFPHSSSDPSVDFCVVSLYNHEVRPWPRSILTSLSESSRARLSLEPSGPGQECWSLSGSVRDQWGPERRHWWARRMRTVRGSQHTQKTADIWIWLLHPESRKSGLFQVVQTSFIL